MKTWFYWWHIGYVIELLLTGGVYLLSFIVPKLKAAISQRRTFEEKNDASYLSVKYEHGFHISSEGELSQVFPVIEQIIDRKLKVILFYTSPSVEKKIIQLSHKYPTYLTTRRIVFARPDYRFLNNLELGTFSLCRYDFLPWLMLVGLKSEKFFLLNATSIKWRNQNFIMKYIRKLFYNQFNLITTSSPLDENIFVNLVSSKNVINIDLRMIEIFKRQRYFRFRDLIDEDHLFGQEYSSRSRSICFGSAWPEDIEVFNQANFKTMLLDQIPFVAIFPHSFSEDNLNKMIRILKLNDTKYRIVKNIEDLSMSKRGEVSIVLVKGILCEVYPFFQHVVIGGGFGNSVHSVLEPMVAKCTTYCGPNVGRSTEVENYLKSYRDKIYVCEDLVSLSKSLVKRSLGGDDCVYEEFEAPEQSKNYKKLLKYYEI
jgi:3-deoxy-D-manno-octulosonic-acid transferase